MPIRFIDPPRPDRAPSPVTRADLSPQDATQALFEEHMGEAETAGLAETTPLHKMAGFLVVDSPTKLHLFDAMETNTEFGTQHRLIVMRAENRDGVPTFTEPLEEFKWNVPRSHQPGDEATFEVHHTSHDPDLGYIGPDLAQELLADMLITQTGPPTALVFAEG